MMKMKRFLSFLCGCFLCFPLWADEGMWMLNRMIPADWDRMQAMGFALRPEQMYDETNPSLYKAVVHFNGGCTGITVSDKGLISTNHHCGFGAVQSQSDVDHDYLTDGFVARAEQDEIPIPGMFVSYLQRVEDVSRLVLDSVPNGTGEREREAQIRKRTEAIRKQYLDSLGGSYSVTISSYLDRKSTRLNSSHS
jgi:hypothetical protein